MAVADYDAIAGNNSDISGINISEGCAPGNINDAFRQMMADIAVFADDVGTYNLYPTSNEVNTGALSQYDVNRGPGASLVPETGEAILIQVHDSPVTNAAVEIRLTDGTSNGGYFPVNIITGGGNLTDLTSTDINGTLFYSAARLRLQFNGAVWVIVEHHLLCGEGGNRLRQTRSTGQFPMSAMVDVTETSSVTTNTTTDHVNYSEIESIHLVGKSTSSLLKVSVDVDILVTGPNASLGVVVSTEYYDGAAWQWAIPQSIYFNSTPTASGNGTLRTKHCATFVLAASKQRSDIPGSFSFRVAQRAIASGNTSVASSPYWVVEEYTT